LSNLINHKNIKICAVLLFVIFAIFDFIQFSVSHVGVDAGYFLSISRDWVNLGNIPSIDTFTAYTTIGYIFYAIPFALLKTPGIEVFLTLNLFLFFFTYFIYFKMVNRLIINKLIVFTVLFSFIYNTHGITADIKLENINLFLNISIIYVLSQFIHKRSVDIYYRELVFSGILLGFLSALSFLTKQYGGLSLMLTILILEILQVKNGRKVSLVVISTFGLIVLAYLSAQMICGLHFNVAVEQMLGKMTINCSGSEYGEQKWSNLLIALKYNRFDIVYFFGVVIGFFLFTKQKSGKKLFNFILSILLLILAQAPFYLQVFPHYKLFGLPFILFIAVVWMSQAKSQTFPFMSIFFKLVLIGLVFLSCYTFYCWGKQYKSKLDSKILRIRFEKKVSKIIPQGSKVYMLTNRGMWFSNHFVTPVPKTISYGFLGMDCLNLAVAREKPESFWVATESRLSDGMHLDDYIVSDRQEIKNNKSNLQVTLYTKMDGK
jgi:hypothetical protein